MPYKINNFVSWDRINICSRVIRQAYQSIWIYSCMVHITAVLRSSGWLKGGFVWRDLHVFFLGSYICTSSVDDLLFCLGLRLSVESNPLCRPNMCSSPSNATKPIATSSEAFLGTVVSFHQRFEDMSYLTNDTKIRWHTVMVTL